MVRDEPAAVTLAAAASRLGVRPQRLNQLLNSGRLKGPRHGSGRQPPNVPRVFEWSLTKELERRVQAAASAGSAPGQPDDRADGSASISSEAVLREIPGLRRLVERAERREEAARAALLHAKAAADNARADAARNRQRAAQLANLLRDTANALADELDRDLDAVASAYSDALTQLAAPADAEQAEKPTI